MSRRVHRLGAWLLVLTAPVLCLRVGSSTQQAPEIDVEEGGRTFQSACATCHGPDGDQIAGIDLGRGRFRRSLSDEDLVGIIRNGISGTPMPASTMSPDQARRVVIYLRSVAAGGRGGSTAGDPLRGRALFEGKGACLQCHRVNGVGSRVGPDLSDIGQFRRVVDLERSILAPDEEVLGQNRFYRVVDGPGVTTTGRLLNLDTFTVQMLNWNEQLRSFIKSDLREYGFIETSPMPSYKDKLTSEELADVMRYLTSLRGS
jgi:putative heme-binding domain-containing protein